MAQSTCHSLLLSCRSVTKMEIFRTRCVWSFIAWLSCLLRGALFNDYLGVNGFSFRFVEELKGGTFRLCVMCNSCEYVNLSAGACIATEILFQLFV